MIPFLFSGFSTAVSRRLTFSDSSRNDLVPTVLSLLLSRFRSRGFESIESSPADEMDVFDCDRSAGVNSGETDEEEAWDLSELKD